MAPGRLPAPGTRLGPCYVVPGQEECVHIDCRRQRRDANTFCWHCNRPIGYETPFFDEGGLVHETCYYEHIKLTRREEELRAQDAQEGNHAR